MPAEAPVVISHANKVGVDHRAFTQLVKTPIADASGLGTLTRLENATDLIDFGGWTNPNKFMVGNGNQNDMANVATVGYTTTVGWDSLAYGPAIGVRTVVGVTFDLHFMARWAATLDGPGEIAVRGMLTFAGQEWYEGIFRFDPRAGRLAAPLPAIPVPAEGIVEMANRWGPNGSAAPEVFALFEERFGHPFTLNDIAGVAIRMQLTSWEGEAAFGAAWWAGPVRMKLQVHMGVGPTQSAAQYRIATDVGMVGLVYDSGKLAGDIGNVHTVPPDVMAGGIAHYTDCQVWDENDVASGLGTPVSFTTLTDGQADLIHEPGELIGVYDYYPGIVLPAGDFFQHAVHNNIWYAPLSAGAQPTPNFTVVDLEEEGEAKGYTELDVIDDGLATLQATPGAFIWDRANYLVAGTAMIYIYSATGPAPGFRAGSLVAKVLWPLATRYMVWNNRNYEGRVLEHSEVRRAVTDLLDNQTSAPTSDFRLSDHDGVLRKMVAREQPPTDGWILDGRPIEYRMVGPSRSAGLTPYDEAPLIFEAITHVPDDVLLQDDVLSLTLAPKELETDAHELGLQTFSRDVYSALRARDIGEPIREVYGLETRGYVEAAVVDMGPEFGGGPYGVLRAVVNSAYTYTVYRDGKALPNILWSYVNPHIIFDGPGVTFGDPHLRLFGDEDHVDADFAVRCQGEGATIYQTVGQVGGYLLARVIPWSQIDYATFAAFSTMAYVNDIDGPTSVLNILHRLMRAGFYHIVQRIDGLWAAVPEKPQYLTTALILHDYEVIGKPGWRLRKDAMGSKLTVTHPGEIGRPVDERGEWIGRNYRGWGQYRLKKEVEVEVDTIDPSVFAEHASRLDHPEKDLTIGTDKRALYAWPGNTVILDLERALGPSGAEDYGLFVIEGHTAGKGGSCVLDLRFVRTLPAEDRP